MLEDLEVEQKICSECGEIKSIEEFYLRKDNNKYRNKCKICFSLQGKNKYIINKEIILKRVSNYRNNNKEKIKINKKIYAKNNRASHNTRNRKYKLNNKEKIQKYNKEYRKVNRKKINCYNKQYWVKNKEKINLNIKNKRKTNSNFKLRTNISCSILRVLKTYNGSKNNQSITKYLPYTIEELKQHLESLFEPWMTWENWGRYNPETWTEDTSTWVWNIDHIIPQSLLPYDSMEHPNFIKCWTLSNLRPYSAKQNIIDGSNKVRHNIKDINAL